MKFKKRATQLTFCVIFINGPNDRTLKPPFLQDLHIIMLGVRWHLRPS